MRFRWHRLPRPRSIQGRFTLTVGMLSLIVLTVIGVGLDLGIRNRIEEHIYGETQRAAIDWIASMRPGLVAPPEATGHVDYLQLVDSRGELVAASASAAQLPPISKDRLIDERPRYLTECPPQGGCLLVAAMRVLPQANLLLWGGERHYVYAGTKEPAILATRYLEGAIAALVLLISAAVAWITWSVVGRTLRPVAAIREKVCEATVNDLSTRVPEPPGDDEIARLARTSNEFLEQLEQAVTYQRRFASMASHELRSPVAALRVQLEEALTYPDEVNPHETIRKTLRTAERFQALIDEVLAYTRVKKTHMSPPAPLDLAALVWEEVEARTHGTPVRIRGGGELVVLGRRLQLIGVLGNLLTNAQRHAHSRVDVTVERVGDQAVVTVLDDGDGIAPGDRERVFEPFVRLADGRRSDPGGSGLGLAICRETAKTHRGTLTVEDSPRGARFVLRLPLMDADRAPARTPDRTPARTRLASTRQP
ncbi:HAMP domain-containing histidine kinase [Sphaerisporangium sp. NBC_01403]|uniref:sensor histidine kinase n=1 Tax=Sphaerisporangium sp. NBC_01403 TaxID=2903599 RepID=UPI003245747D